MKKLYSSNKPDIFCMVDDEDCQELSAWTWMAKAGAGKVYFQGWRPGSGPIKKFYLHRIVMKAKRGEFLDHIDNNPLNNQKSNLRFCSHKQNMANRSVVKGKKYKGVYRHNTPSGVVYKVYLIKDFIGQFKCEHQAALLYDLAAKATFGEFARCNLLNHGGE